MQSAGPSQSSSIPFAQFSRPSLKRQSAPSSQSKSPSQSSSSPLWQAASVFSGPSAVHAPPSQSQSPSRQSTRPSQSSSAPSPHDPSRGPVGTQSAGGQRGVVPTASSVAVASVHIPARQVRHALL